MNIIVAFSKPEDGRNIKNILTKNGISVAVSCTAGSQVLANADDLRNGIVISGFRFGDMTCRQMSSQLPEGFDVLLIAAPLRWSGQDMGRIVCLPTPFKMTDLVSTVRMMGEMQTKRRRERRRQPQARQDEDRRVIERAKDLLIHRNHMTEPEAHRYLQKCSMDSGTGMVEAARMVLSLFK